jgi:hypothetical protein
MGAAVFSGDAGMRESGADQVGAEDGGSEIVGSSAALINANSARQIARMAQKTSIVHELSQ